MGLRIQTNADSLKAQRNLAKSSQKLSENMERLSSGYRINKAADDAAGLAISSTLTAKLRSMAQAKRNASDGISLIQVAEGSMNEMTNIIVRLRELATQAASDTIGNRERSFVNKEYNELVDEIDRISNTTEFNGVYLLKGGGEVALDQLGVHVGSGDASQPNRDVISIDLRDLMLNSQEALGIEKGSAVGPLDPEDGSFERSTAAEKITVLEKALNKMNNVRSTLGAKQSRITSTITNLSTAYENMSASRSRIRDVDFAFETAAYAQSRILQQAGVSVLGQANNLPEVALSLLR